MKVPASLVATGRTYYLLRSHEGTAAVVAQGTKTTLSGESDLFSTYALAYAEPQQKSGSKTQTKPKTQV